MHEVSTNAEKEYKAEIKIETYVHIQNETRNLMAICIIKMVNYPWIVNSDIIMVNLVPTEKHTFV